MTTTEPYCNHDPEAISDGVCECGEIVGPCTECGTSDGPFTDVNLEAVCEDCADELSTAGERIALDLIAAELAGWTDDPSDDTDRLTAIVRIVRGTGRDVKDSNWAEDEEATS